MRTWIRIGIVVVTVAVLLGAATGGYALVGLGGTDEKPSLPGFELVRPAFAQTATAAFPVTDAGISAYVQVDSAGVDFDQIITTVFNGMVSAGDNYIIGTVAIDQGIWLTRTVDVNVYVDTDGWIVAYLTVDKPNAEIFSWTQWIAGSDLNTVLEEALEETVAAILQFIDPAQIGWYYWANPNATHFAAAARAGEGNLFLAIPVQAILYRKPSYSWHSRDPGTFSNSGSLTLTKLGAPGLTLESPGGTRFAVKDVDMDKGAMYTLKAANGSGGSGQHRLGVAVVYKAP